MFGALSMNPVDILARRILKWFLKFQKICVSLIFIPGLHTTLLGFHVNSSAQFNKTFS